MTKTYVGNTGKRIRVRLCKNITDFTSMTYKVKKPDETETEWDCSIESYVSGIVYHTVTTGDFDQNGRYYFNPYLVDKDGFIWKSDTKYFDIYEGYK